MPRPLRDKSPGLLHMLTLRTEQALLWLKPSKDLNNTIGGVLARYQEIFNVVIYAYCFLGNHFHLLVKPLLNNLDEFAENVNRELARRINKLHNRKGHLWSRRYDDQLILIDEDALEALLYIVTNPVKHGLVPLAGQWPGLSCYGQLMTGKELAFPFVHYSEREKGKPKITQHRLILNPLPQLAKVSLNERRLRLTSYLEERSFEIAKERREAGKGFLGVRGVGKIKAGSRPREVSCSPRPSCYTQDPEVRRRHLEERKAFMERYREASIRYRLGDTKAEFPPYCFKPPLHRRPRRRPFVEYKSLSQVA